MSPTQILSIPLVSVRSLLFLDVSATNWHRRTASSRLCNPCMSHSYSDCCLPPSLSVSAAIPTNVDACTRAQWCQSHGCPDGAVALHPPIDVVISLLLKERHHNMHLISTEVGKGEEGEWGLPTGRMMVEGTDFARGAQPLMVGGTLPLRRLELELRNTDGGMSAFHRCSWCRGGQHHLILCNTTPGAIDNGCATTADGESVNAWVVLLPKRWREDHGLAAQNGKLDPNQRVSLGARGESWIKKSQAQHAQLHDEMIRLQSRVKELTKSEASQDKRIQDMEADASSKAVIHLKQLKEFSDQIVELEVQNSRLNTARDEAVSARQAAEDALKVKDDELQKMKAELEKNVAAAKKKNEKLEAKVKEYAEAENFLLQTLAVPSNLLRKDFGCNLQDRIRHDVHELVQPSRVLLKKMTVKEAETCDSTKLVEAMKDMPDLILGWQKSSARGGARQALCHMLAHYPKADLDAITAGVPAGSEGKVVSNLVRGFNQVLAKHVDHNRWYQEFELYEESSSNDSKDGEEQQGEEEAAKDESATSEAPARADPSATTVEGGISTSALGDALDTTA